MLINLYKIKATKGKQIVYEELMPSIYLTFTQESVEGLLKAIKPWMEYDKVTFEFAEQYEDGTNRS